ncbi:MAG: hypothetical protein K0R10_1236 [Alphaproteobacteria bacterium]|jgi:hypothetical protein|nr:hypothetical protein [Alphaproteobacteria bacterium]
MKAKKKTPKTPTPAAPKRAFFTPLGLFFFVLSLVYIVAEAVFNMQLLEVAGSVKSDPDTLDKLQYFGRTVSAFGFTLLVLGLFQSSGFYLRTKRDWWKFLGVATVCIIPFIMVFRHSVPELMPKGYTAPLGLEPVEVMISVLPLLGLFMVLASGGRWRPQIIICLILLAWPAMFLGQKLLIESYVVDSTDWEERQNARYMLMLRAGLEDCVLTLGDLQLCKDDQGAPDLKAARIIVSALWMMKPEAILRDLEMNRDSIVESAAIRGVWFSPQDQYKSYVKKVEKTRDKYEKDVSNQFYTKYYNPYKKASEMYQKAIDPASLDAQSKQAVDEIDKEMEEGWKKYRAAVRDFEQTVSVIVAQAMRDAMSVGGTVNAICAARDQDCPEVDTTPYIRTAQRKAIREFTLSAGYPPSISEKEDFLKHPKTKKMVNERVQMAVRSRFDMPDFTLPETWEYEPNDFQRKISALIKEQAEKKWNAKFGKKLPPGLNEAEFMKTLGVDTSLPPVEQMLMTEEMFFKKYVMPGNQRLVTAMLDDLRNERKLHPDDAVEMETGKDYVKALYIPTISLVVSLSVVMMTVMRGVILLPAAMGRVRIWKYQLSPMTMRFVMAGGFIGFLLWLPYAVPNPYASGATYKRYYAAAAAEHSFVAGVMNWAVHVQPVIYRAGTAIRDLRVKKPAQQSQAPTQN